MCGIVLRKTVICLNFDNSIGIASIFSGFNSPLNAPAK